MPVIRSGHLRPSKSFSKNTQKPLWFRGRRWGRVQNELVQMSQFPLVAWQITAHMAVSTQVLWVNDAFDFQFFCFFFFKLLPKTQNCQRWSCKTCPVLCLKCSPLFINHQANHTEKVSCPQKKTSFHSLMDSSLPCSGPLARVSQGHQGESPKELVIFFSFSPKIATNI